MIRFMYSREKTDAFRPIPWHWNEEPFPAFRGTGASYKAFQAVAPGYLPDFDGDPPLADGLRCPPVATDIRPSRLIQTRKGTWLIIPVLPDKDRKIVLVTLRGGHKGYYSRLQWDGATVRPNPLASNDYDCPTIHLVAQFKRPDGYIVAESGEGCGTGIVELVTWDGIQEMTPEEFVAWKELRQEQKCDNQ